MIKRTSHTLSIDATTWMRHLADGTLNLKIVSPGYGTYGGPHASWGVSDRQLSSHIFYAVIKGAIEARWGSNSALIEPGSIFWLSPYVIHHFALSAGRPISLFHFRLGAADSRGRTYRLKDDALLVKNADSLRSVFEEIIALAHTPVSFEQERKQGLFLVLCSSIFGAPQQSQSDFHLTRQQRSTLETLVSRCDRGFFSPTELANELDLSPEYFARLFRNTYGQKPRTWIVRHRVRQAAAMLLETSASIAEVAARFGYPNTYFFSRQFRKFIGSSPRAYRKNQQTP